MLKREQPGLGSIAPRADVGTSRGRASIPAWVSAPPTFCVEM